MPLSPAFKITRRRRQVVFLRNDISSYYKRSCTTFARRRQDNMPSGGWKYAIIRNLQHASWRLLSLRWGHRPRGFGSSLQQQPRVEERRGKCQLNMVALGLAGSPHWQSDELRQPLRQPRQRQTDTDGRMHQLSAHVLGISAHPLTVTNGRWRAWKSRPQRLPPALLAVTPILTPMPVTS